MVLSREQTKLAYSEVNIDNLLVGQKNEIIQMIDSGRIDQAMASLTTVRAMWLNLGYGYKLTELKSRINHRLGL